MTSDELTKQLKHCGLVHIAGRGRFTVYDQGGQVVFTLSSSVTSKDVELKLREYKKEIKKREIKTTTESKQGELL